MSGNKAHGMQNRSIESCIETICQKGCQQVRQDILLLEQGRHLPEISHLDTESRRYVLQELKAVMAIYGNSCRI